MKLTTIWTLLPWSNMSLRERLHRTKEWVLIETAHRMPRALAHRTYYDVLARYTWAHPQAEVPAILAMDVTNDFPVNQVKR